METYHTGRFTRGRVIGCEYMYVWACSNSPIRRTLWDASQDYICNLESTDFHRHSYTLSFLNYRFEIPFSSHERPTPDTYVHIACEPRARVLIQSVHLLRMVVDKLLGFWVIKIYREAIVIYNHTHVSQSTFSPLFLGTSTYGYDRWTTCYSQTARTGPRQA